MQNPIRLKAINRIVEEAGASLTFRPIIAM